MVNGLSFKPICDNIFLVEAEDRSPLGETFVRFSTYLDSPIFGGKTFSLEQFKQWYAAKHNGKFTYYTDYRGFNVPDSVMEVFLRGEFNPLSENEKWLLRNIQSCNCEKPYYVIGYVKGMSNTLKHELCHAFYYVAPDYKESADSVVDEFLLKCDSGAVSKVCNYLKRFNYNDAVWKDELHAYLISNKADLEKYGAWTNEVEQYSKRLNAIFENECLWTFKPEEALLSSGAFTAKF